MKDRSDQIMAELGQSDKFYEQALSEHPKLSYLVPDRKNANKGTARGAEMIEDSLRKYGAGRSVLIDKHGRIIGGNKTVEHAAQIGMEDLIIVQTDGTKLVAVQRTDLDLEHDPRAKELAIADNRTAQVSLDWDAEMLAQLNEEIDLTGFFSPDELSGILGDQCGTELLVGEDEVPDAPAEPITKLGDLVVMGKHRLLCGDSTDIAQVEQLCGDTQVDVLLTDPPYNVALGMNETPEQAKRRNRRTDGLSVLNDQQSAEDFRQFLADALSAALVVMKPGAVFYIWHADSEGYTVRGACLDAGLTVHQCLIWNKQSLVMGRQDYHWKHEPCLYGWKDGAGHLWVSDRLQTTVLEFDRPTASKDHPTMKPVALFAYQMLNNTKGGDIVLDLFAGSGTTAIAAEKHGRIAYLMELDPRYCDVIVTRWENATGRKAERGASAEAN